MSRALPVAALFACLTTPLLAADGGEPPALHPALARTAAKLAAGEPVHLVAFGDSISEVGRSPRWHGGASSPATHWASLVREWLAKRYPEAEVRLTHAGIGGQNSYEGLGRTDSVLALEPELVFVAFGTNDCWWHHLHPDQTRRALSELISRVKPKADVVVLSTAGNAEADERFRHVELTVAATRLAAERGGVPFVDTHAAVRRALAQHTWADLHLGKTNAHPNDAGHRVWAGAVTRVLSGEGAPAGDPREKN